MANKGNEDIEMSEVKAFGADSYHMMRKDSPDRPDYSLAPSVPQESPEVVAARQLLSENGYMTVPVKRGCQRFSRGCKVLGLWMRFYFCRLSVWAREKFAECRTKMRFLKNELGEKWRIRQENRRKQAEIAAEKKNEERERVRQDEERRSALLKDEIKLAELRENEARLRVEEARLKAVENKIPEKPDEVEAEVAASPNPAGECVPEVRVENTNAPVKSSGGAAAPSAAMQSSGVVNENPHDREWFSFRGRATRNEYWIWTFPIMSATILLGGALGVAAIISYNEHGRVTDNVVLLGLFAVLVFVVAGTVLLPVNVRRLHDRNMSGWWLLLFWLGGLVPYLGGVVGFIQLIVLGCLDGDIGPNDFGPDPKGRVPSPESDSGPMEPETILAPSSDAMAAKDPAPSGLTCPNCHGAVLPGERFCRKCGTRVDT